MWLREPALALTWFRQVLEGVGFWAVGLARWHVFVRYLLNLCVFTLDYLSGCIDFTVEHPVKTRLYLRTPVCVTANCLSYLKHQHRLKLAEDVFGCVPRPLKPW